MVAYYPNYNQGLNSTTNPNVQTHNQACYNVSSSMPSGRQTACGQPQLATLSTDRSFARIVAPEVVYQRGDEPVAGYTDVPGVRLLFVSHGRR